MKLQHLHELAQPQNFRAIKELMHATMVALSDAIMEHDSKYFISGVQRSLAQSTAKMWIIVRVRDGYHSFMRIGTNSLVWPSIMVWVDSRSERYIECKRCNAKIDLNTEGIETILALVDHYYYRYKTGHW